MKSLQHLKIDLLNNYKIQKASCSRVIYGKRLLLCIQILDSTSAIANAINPSVSFIFKYILCFTDLSAKLNAWVNMETPEKPSAKALMANENEGEKLTLAIFKLAFPISKIAATITVIESGSPKLQMIFIIIEKKKINDQTFNNMTVELFIESTNENLVLDILASKCAADILVFHISAQIAVAKNIDKYSLIPSIKESRIAIPTPDITNAIDGFVEIGNNFLYSFSPIFLFL